MSAATDERRHRRLLGIAGTIALVGIALSVGADSGIGGWLALGGIVALIVGLHRLGRLGPG